MKNLKEIVIEKGKNDDNNYNNKNKNNNQYILNRKIRKNDFDFFSYFPFFFCLFLCAEVEKAKMKNNYMKRKTKKFSYLKMKML